MRRPGFFDRNEIVRIVPAHATRTEPQRGQVAATSDRPRPVTPGATAPAAGDAAGDVDADGAVGGGGLRRGADGVGDGRLSRPQRGGLAAVPAQLDFGRAVDRVVAAGDRPERAGEGARRQ